MDEPYVTKTGKVLSDADIQALADEAEQGYDVSHLKGKPNRRRCSKCGRSKPRDGFRYCETCVNDEQSSG
jgi:NAD-dependent SIR2 family protein deacetylase